jgi:hypothetical protein
MTASTLVTIMCDEPDCAQWWDAGIADTAARARAQLKGSGWALAISSGEVQRGRLDFCPAHANRQSTQ